MFWQSEPYTEQITTMDNYKLNRLSMTGIGNLKKLVGQLVYDSAAQKT